MQREEKKSKDLSEALDALNRGKKPAITCDEVRELTEVAILLKSANPPLAVVEKLTTRLAAEITARRKRRRWWLASSVAGTIAVAGLVLVLNLPSAVLPPPLVIPPTGSVVVERIPADKTSADKPAAVENRTMSAAKRAVDQTGVAASVGLATERILFATDRFGGWDWYKKAYPPGMAFAIVTGPEQSKGEPSVPSAILDRAGEIDYSRQLLVVAYLGTGGGADAIGVERVTLSGREMTVRVRTKSIRPGELETMNISNPADFAILDRSLAGGVTQATFIDQKGAVLATIVLTKP